MRRNQVGIGFLSAAFATVFFAAAISRAAVQEADTQSGTGFTVSNSDLLQAPGVAGAVNDTALIFPDVSSGDLAVLTNGQFGDPGGSSDFSQNVAIHNGAVITYTLNLATSPAGYNITNISTYTGWADGGRDAQQYTVSYSTVLAPNTFLPIATVNYNPPPVVAPSDTRVVLTDSLGGNVAIATAKLQFSFPTVENGFVLYRELDVSGSAVPEPFGAAFIALIGSWITMRRRRNEVLPLLLALQTKCR